MFLSGERVRVERARRSLTAAEFARLSRISRQALRDTERDGTTSTYIISRIASALAMTTEELCIFDAVKGYKERV